MQNIANGLETSIEQTPVHSGMLGLHHTLLQIAQHAAAPEFASSEQFAQQFLKHRCIPRPAWLSSQMCLVATARCDADFSPFSKASL